MLLLLVVPDDLKDRLDELLAIRDSNPNPPGLVSMVRNLLRGYGHKEDIVTGHLVVKQLGLEKIRTWASEIAILSAYLAERTDQGV